MVGFRRSATEHHQVVSATRSAVRSRCYRSSVRGLVAAESRLPRYSRAFTDRVARRLRLKAGVAAALAIWLGDRIYLRDSYWAGISAVVATAGTLCASLAAAISRISATLVGLAVGLASFALPLSGTLVEGATVSVTLIVLPALSLDTGARLGAATMLIVTAIPGQNAVSDALARGANVPLGCAVAVIVGVLLWPHRAGERVHASRRAETKRARAGRVRRCWRISELSVRMTSRSGSMALSPPRPLTAPRYTPAAERAAREPR
jgi:uncharacterized membrane protein YccC